MTRTDSLQMIKVFHIICCISGFIIGTCMMTWGLINIDSPYELALLIIASFLIVINVFYCALLVIDYLLKNPRKVLYAWYSYGVFILFIFTINTIVCLYLIVLIFSVPKAASLLVSSISLMIYFFIKLCLCYLHSKFFSALHMKISVVDVHENAPPSYGEIYPAYDNNPVNTQEPPAYFEIVVENGNIRQGTEV